MESKNPLNSNNTHSAWKNYLVEKESQENLKNYLDNQGLIIFFKKDGEIYGGNESARVVFARMKHPDEEYDKDWKKQASFSATNLEKLVQGEPSSHMFDQDDMKNIKIIDQKDVLKALSGKSLKPTGMIKIMKFSFFNNGPSNLSRKDEE